MASKCLIVLAGPTAVGKTQVAIALAKTLHAEIVNADSRQVYGEMKIGTAMPSESQLAEVRHHLVGHRTIQASYNASIYENEAIEILNQLFDRFDQVILTGGSGMYIDAVCSGIDDIPAVDPSVREKLRATFQEKGIEYIRTMLSQADPEYFGRVDLNNPKRILKALEVSETSGRPYSGFLTGKPKKRPFSILKIGLDLPRTELHSRINRRTEMMIKEGLVEEARALLPFRQLNALNTVGYKEVFDYLGGSVSLEEATLQIQGHTRQYARRQLTWFRKDGNMTWFNPADTERMISWIRELQET